MREPPQAGCTGLPDIERLNRKLEKRKIGLADLCQLYRASSRLPMIEEAIREHEGSHSELLCTRYLPPAMMFMFNGLVISGLGTYALNSRKWVVGGKVSCKWILELPPASHDRGGHPGARGIPLRAALHPVSVTCCKLR